MQLTLPALTESNRYLKNGERLRQILREDGYLFFRGLLDPRTVRRTAEDVQKILAGYGITQKQGSGWVWTGRSFASNKDRLKVYTEILSLKSFKDLSQSKEITGTFELILGGSINVWVQKVSRFVLPKEESSMLPPHQDYYYLRGSPEFYTTWIPFIEMDRSVGGLAVAKGSNHLGISDENYVHTGEFPAAGIPEEGRRFEWHWSEYHIGDAIMFTNYTVHKSMPNTSNKVRLSADYRYQLKGTKTEWSSRRRHDWFIARKYEVYELAAKAGVTDKVVQERIFREVILTPEMPNLKRVRKAIAQMQARS